MSIKDNAIFCWKCCDFHPRKCFDYNLKIWFMVFIPICKTCLQGTLWRGDTLWSGGTFSAQYLIFPMLMNLLRRDTCHVGTFSLGYWGVPCRQVLLHLYFSFGGDSICSANRPSDWLVAGLNPKWGSYHYLYT